MKLDLSLVSQARLQQFTASYASFKVRLEQEVRREPQSELAKAYTFIEKKVDGLTNNVLPTLYRNAPDSIVKVIKNYFWPAPVMSYVAALVYDSSFCVDALLGITTAQLSLWDRQPTNRTLVRDAAIGLLALHALKLGYDSIKYLNSGDPSNAFGVAYDLYATCKLGLIIHNKNSS